MAKLITRDIQGEMTRLRQQGMTLPNHPGRAEEYARNLRSQVYQPGALDQFIRSTENTRRSPEGNYTDIGKRKLLAAAGDGSSMRKTGTIANSDAILAAPRYYDPVDYWNSQGIPYRQDKPQEMKKLRGWLRLYYTTHYLIPTLIDIYTRFPLLGMELDHNDRGIKEFYDQVFMDERGLNYPQHLADVGRERWIIGEAFVLGAWNEPLAIWEREEILNPDDIIVHYYQLFGINTYEIEPPPYLKELVNGQTTEKASMADMAALKRDYPEIIDYINKNKNIPVSDVLLKQLAFKVNKWDRHGTSILMRAMKTLMHEEKLNACQDAIAERLYSPLIMAKLGATNSEMGDEQGPWIPDDEQLASFRDDLDMALSSDFRALVYHFGLDIKSVFGRESVPNLDHDFDRIEKRLMQIFGINPAILQGGTSTNSYAGQALNIEFLSLMMGTYQNEMQSYFKQRAEVVAEAHGHYAYEEHGNGQRVPIYEEFLEWAEPGEEGNEDGDEGVHIKVRQPALTIPELKMKTLNLRDMNQEREFLKMLRDMGVPIPDDKFMVGLEWNPEELATKFVEEKVGKIVAEQEYWVRLYRTLVAKELPIPQEVIDKLGPNWLEKYEGKDMEKILDETFVAPGETQTITEDALTDEQAQQVDKDEEELDTEPKSTPEQSHENDKDAPKKEDTVKTDDKKSAKVYTKRAQKVAMPNREVDNATIGRKKRHIITAFNVPMNTPVDTGDDNE